MDPFKAMLLDATADHLIKLYYDPRINDEQRERLMRDVEKIAEHEPSFHKELLRRLTDADPCKAKIKEASAEEEAKKAIAKMMGNA